MWIGSLAHRKPSFSLNDIRRIIEKLKNILLPPKKKSSDFEVNSPIIIHPFIIPLHDYKFVRKINSILLKRTILKAIRVNNFHNPILITSTPLISGLIGELGETSSHYFCLDDYSNFDGAFKSLIAVERELLTKISSCFAVSDVLLSTRKTESGNNYFLSQGVQSEHFQKNSLKIPPRIKDLKKPVIGFFGLISEWIDLDLIVYAACELPAYSFLVVGKPSVDLSVFNNYPNIVFIGEVPFKDLPSYASVFDVGIIPFKVNELTLACNPLKLLEYLSLGIPVVSVNLPEVQKFKSVTYIADNYEDFVRLIKLSLEENSEEKMNLRLVCASEHSWTSITNSICEKIDLIERVSG
jgi:glycosyltransferase involved in cell wall biosynthesis